MPVAQQIIVPRKIYLHKSTSNQSFLDIYYYLRDKGIKNNAFFLAIYDPDLIGIDPRDPEVMKSRPMQMKILRECMINYWYFIREVVRIPDEGGSVGGGARYKLHRGNLAMNFLFSYNLNQFVEFPRQHFKTTSALCRYLWIFNFGTTNSEMMFINKKHDDSKDNLADLKNIRSSLPSYLRMDHMTSRDGKIIKVPNSVETLKHPINNNVIKTLPGARNKALAHGLGRGCTMPIHYYDEFAFIIYNKIIYGAATPSYSRASANAKLNFAPYGILITTTPGDLTTDEGLYACQIKDDATPFNELMYDWSYQELLDAQQANVRSNFFYVRYSYQQLGSGEDYFIQMCKDLNNDWPTIRREILLEWTKTATNCPFKQEDLDIIKTYLIKEPINTLFFGPHKQYQMQVWKPLDLFYIPIVGVDVAGGHTQDSSAITIIDSKTTDVTATLNCNYITTTDLTQVLIELVMKNIRNAVVNIEANGGFGSSVISNLMKSPIKKNLYYEIKDKVREERTNGVSTIRKSEKVKEYGLTSTGAVRERLIEILHERVNYHKDKFNCPLIHSELETMEVKKNGKTEHASNCHDDQVFSYLMAMYVWYDGKNILENFGIRKSTLKTDEAIVESYVPIEDHYKTLLNLEIINSPNSDSDIEINKTIEILNSGNKKSILEFDHLQNKRDRECLSNILNTDIGRKAYIEKYHIDMENDSEFNNSVSKMYTIPDEFFIEEQDMESKEFIMRYGDLADQFNNLTDFR